MEICIRENYIDKISITKTHIIIDEFGKEHEELMYRREDLVKPPYNYKIVEIDDKYSDCVASDFNDDLTFSEMKYNTRKSQEMAEQRIAELKKKLFDTDYRAIKFAEGELTEEEYAPYREERRAWREEINSLGG